jgi:hypothetical protein
MKQLLFHNCIIGNMYTGCYDCAECMRQLLKTICDSLLDASGFSAESNITWTEWLRHHKLLSLFEVNAEYPPFFNTLIWKPHSQDRKAAWSLYTELCTRIATQPLSYRSGDEDTALKSIHDLFELSRSIIRNNYGCSHFATLTMEVLNTRIRPFTAKWHRAKVDRKLGSADVRFTFRLELAQLQTRLRAFAHLLKLLIGDKTLDAHVKEHQPADDAGLFNPVPFEIPEEDRWIPVDVKQVNVHEQKEILERRKFYQVQNQDQALNAIGLSISGGGIRSATFALGVVQVLARKGILSQVDYLSTVSGGGYLGSFISSFLNNPDPKVTLKPDLQKLPFGHEGESESQAVRHLRNHSKYLSEGGLKNRTTMVGLIFYGVFVSLLLLSPLILLPAVAVKLLSYLDIRWQVTSPVTLTWPDLWLVGVLLTSVLLLPIAQFISPNGIWQRRWQGLCIVAGLISILLKVVEFLRWIFFSESRPRAAITILGYTVLGVFFLALLGVGLGSQRKAGRALLRSLVLIGPLFLMLLFFWISALLIRARNISSPTLLVLIVIIFIYTTFIININYASPHLFYRNRLARTYVTRSSRNSDNVEAADPQLLSAMNASDKAPYHLINAALNIPKCDNPNLRGRNTDFFLFSKHFCGSPILGYHPTKDWEKMERHLDLATAMAISGAAAAPQMGTITSSQYTFLLAMLNVRLGYWVRRPMVNTAPLKWLHRILPPVGWYYFFRELTGLMNEKTRYVNVSDGGHIENLGIYELLRRRCKFIIAIDGEADPKRSFGGLLTLTQLASIDLGVRIEPDLSDLRIDNDGLGKAHFGLSKIEYSNGCRGLLLYIKSSLTGNESEFLKKYQREHPDFPHQSTAQQLYSETQFEAYRALGEHIAEDLFRSDLVGKDFKVGTEVKKWFNELVNRLL